MPLFGICEEWLGYCGCRDLITGEGFSLPLSERDGIYKKSTSTVGTVSTLLVIAMALEPEFSEVKSRIADPALYYDGVVSKLRLLDY